MSFESIEFPSASIASKLSASPTTKVPQAADWIFQDFFNTMLENPSFNHDKALSIPDVFPYEKLSIIQQNHLFFEREDSTIPISIESDILSEAPSSMEATVQYEDMTVADSILTKRKSTSSFGSLKSFMSVFHTNKKYKQDVATLAMKYSTESFQKKKPNSITRKFTKLFKVGF